MLSRSASRGLAARTGAIEYRSRAQRSRAVPSLSQVLLAGRSVAQKIEARASAQVISRPGRARPGQIHVCSRRDLLRRWHAAFMQSRRIVKRQSSDAKQVVPSLRVGANPSIEGTSNIRLRLLSAAPHVKR
jgi:hypothetical protein